jgi:hypothetical protein
MKTPLRLVLVCAFISSSISLTSCVYWHREPISPFQRDQVCEELKQQILLSSARNAPDEFGKMPNDTAFLYKKYEENNCPEKLDNTY